MRLLSYNIRYGGTGRESILAENIRHASPDLVVLQEATKPHVVEQLARETGLPHWGAKRGESLAFLSREALSEAGWHQPRFSRHAFLELVPAGTAWRVFGVHLSAVHAAWTERRRWHELRALLVAIEQHQHGPHVLVGDFNTVAPGDLFDLRKLPARLRALVWLSGGRIRWRTIRTILDGDYVDAFRHLHPDTVGHTFPTWDPHVRLDYVFVPKHCLARVTGCEVLTAPPHVAAASDHFPLVAELS